MNAQPLPRCQDPPPDRCCPLLHAPTWATWLIALVPTLLILGAVLYLWGGEGPDNTVTHEQDDEDPPDSSDDGPRDVLLAA